MAFWQWISRHNGILAPLCSAGAMVLVLWRFFSGGLPSMFGLGTLMGLVAIIACGIGLPALALQRQMAIAKAALERCDPEPLLAYSLFLLQVFDGRSNHSRRTRINALSNQMVALDALGRLTEADEISRRLQAGLSVAAADIRGILLLNLSSLRLDQHRLEEAAAFLDEAERLLAQQPLKKKPVGMNYALEANRLSCQLGESDNETALPVVLALAQKYSHSTMRIRVITQFGVAVHLLALRRQEEALSYLRFVAEHGGKLWQCAWAAAQLEALTAKR